MHRLLIRGQRVDLANLVSLWIELQSNIELRLTEKCTITFQAALFTRPDEQVAPCKAVNKWINVCVCVGVGVRESE